MVKIDVGGSQSRPATVPGTPKEISSASGQNVPPQTNVPSTGTKKRMYLMECDEDVATGKTNYCRRIPIYDEPIPGRYPTARAKPRKCPQVSLARQPQMVSVHRLCVTFHDGYRDGWDKAHLKRLMERRNRKKTNFFEYTTV